MDILVKADDLVFGQREDIWLGFCEVLRRHDVPGTIGVIGGASLRRLRRGIETSVSLQKALQAVELWNHGFRHDHREFRGKPIEDQADAIARAQAAIEEVYKRTPRVFGAPFNELDDSTPAACELASVPFLFGPVGTSVVGAIPIDGLFAFETDRSQGRRRVIVNPHPGRFRGRYELAKRHPGLVVMQLHPRRWNKRGLLRFESMLLQLKEDDCRFLSMDDAIDNHVRR